MAYVREETVDRFTDEELLEIVKKNLDQLGIPYEEGPGDWSGLLGLDGADFDPQEQEESYMLQPSRASRSRYRTKTPADYHVGPVFNVDSLTLTAVLWPEVCHESEDGSVLAAA